MKTIILGAGSVGIQIARQLISEGRDLVLIDRDEETVRDAVNSLDCMVILGEANRKETLVQAGASSADIFISVTDSDELNIIACGMVSTEFQVKTTIARVRNEEYTAAFAAGRSFMGITHVINPDIEAAQAILRTIEHGVTSEVMQFQNSNFEMRTLTVTEQHRPGGRTLAQIKQDSGKQFLVAVIVRDGETIIPGGATEVLSGDQLYLIGTQAQLEETFAWFGRPKQRPRKILLVGGGRIGTHILKGLTSDQDLLPRQSLLQKLKGILLPKAKNSGRSITVIESDHEQCKRLSEEFPEVLVRNGDVSEDSILEEDDLSSYDLLITATENQELNLITAIYGKSLGVPRMITLVKKSSYLSMANHFAVDAAVSLNNTIVNSILRLVRRGNIRSVHSISEGKLEFIELSCREGDLFDQKRIQDIRLPKDTLILFVTRSTGNHLPSGSLQIQAGDTLVLITKSESVKKLEEAVGARL